MADGFLGRWAQRKNAVLQGKALEEPVPGRPVAASSAPVVKGPVPGAVPSPASPDVLAKAPADASRREPTAEQPAPLTLDDVQGLTKDSDFKPFMNKAVEPGVRNAAMKKLFTDPHFNVMDRMDIYIDDYSQPDPIPAAMLRQMAGAKFLKLFEDEEKPEIAQAGTASDADAATPASPVSQSPAEKPAQDTPTGDNLQLFSTAADFEPHQYHHAHSDLRLQPDHAAESPDPGRGAA